ncbi:hypothetical protein ACI2K4_26475 [Micromonospora sp. NPDC050397]|uniref:hypothetical protein n=1 Tax=Micromonospora sp. NPDC050397 TaxID=3364279 RepID=UPI00384F4C3C
MTMRGIRDRAAGTLVAVAVAVAVAVLLGAVLLGAVSLGAGGPDRPDHRLDQRVRHAR